MEEKVLVLKEMPDPILITGAARSRTSMVAGIINMCGAFGGAMSGPTHNNRKGMFENARIRNSIVKPYLKQIGADPMGQYPLPDINNLLIPMSWKRRIVQIMKEEGYKGGPWMDKLAKGCLIWPILNIAFPNAKWVIVRRDADGIVKSCIRTGFMRAFRARPIQRAVGAKDEAEGWLWWIRQHEKRFAEMHEAGLHCREVSTDRMIDGDLSEIMDCIDWLGLEWNQKAESFVDPNLTHFRAKQCA